MLRDESLFSKAPSECIAPGAGHPIAIPLVVLGFRNQFLFFVLNQELNISRHEDTFAGGDEELFLPSLEINTAAVYHPNNDDNLVENHSKISHSDCTKNSLAINNPFLILPFLSLQYEFCLRIWSYSIQRFCFPLSSVVLFLLLLRVFFCFAPLCLSSLRSNFFTLPLEIFQYLAALFLAEYSSVI